MPNLNRRSDVTKIEAAVWEAWNALPDDHPAPVKAIATKLGMAPADVAFVVFPAETFGQWSDDQEPDLA
jgi:hypothetical protein